MDLYSRLRAAALVLALTVSLAGCTALFAEPAPQPLPAVTTSLPSDQLTVLAEGDLVAASISASAALFANSPVAVLARVGNQPAQLAGASIAVSLGVPLLLVGEATVPITAELDRLAASNVVIVGELDDEVADGREVTRVTPTTEGMSAALAMDFTGRGLPAAGSAAQAVADLVVGDALVAASTVDATATPQGGDQSALQKFERGEVLSEVLALAVNDDAQLAPIATARAAGVRIHLIDPDATNPQGSPEVIAALSEAATGRVLALGNEFESVANLDWKVASARTGFEFPAGGQHLFPGHTMVAIYGTPNAPVLGVLGEQGLDASIERAREHAARYDGLTDTVILPAFEIITTVASAFAGTDGDYSNEIDIDELRPWVEAAGEAGLYVVLDLQPGRTDFLTQAKRYEELLVMPWVGLALDPEWRLGPNDRHLVKIGSVGAREVNTVVDYLTELVHANDLPPKLLVLHQFRLDMITDRDKVTVDRDEVTVLIHVDGQGSQPAKQDTWFWLRNEAPDVYWGWKNFYDEDIPVLTAEQTVLQVSPLPQLITYQ